MFGLLAKGWRVFRKITWDWLDLRDLINQSGKAHSRIRKNLYWYGMPITYVASLGGLFYMYMWNIYTTIRLLFWPQTQSQSQKDTKCYYHDDMGFKGNHASNPGVWYYQGIESGPWYKFRDSRSSRPIYVGPECARESVELNVKTIKDNLSLLQQSWAKIRYLGQQIVGDKWSAISAINENGRNIALERHIPKFFKFMDSLPFCTNFGAATFFTAQQGCHIESHYGSTNLLTRYEICVSEIDEKSKSHIRVGDQVGSWQKDEVIVFDGSYSHEIVYHGLSKQTLVIFDLWNPQLTEREIQILSHPIFSTFGRLED